MKTRIKNWFKNHNYQWKYKLVVCLPLFLVLVAIDWITKGVVQGTMIQGDTAGHGFISWGYIINPGAARNFMATNMGGAIALATVITVLILVIFIFVNDKMWLIAITFLLAGSFANLLARAWAPAFAFDSIPTDRRNDPAWIALVGSYGGVIDFISVDMSWINPNWSYINNMADNWVVIGIILLIAFIIVEIVKASKEAYRNKHEVEVIDTPKTPKSGKTTVTKIDESKLSEKELKAYNKLKKKSK